MSDVFDDDYILNGKKFAVVMVLDTSGSMGSQIYNLEKAFNEFVEYAKNDDDIRPTMDLALITFSSEVVDQFEGFCDISNVPKIHLTAMGTTNMSDALKLANEMVRERTRTYTDNGIEAFKPWIITMSDGKPDKVDEVLEIGKMLKQRQEDGKVRLVSLGMGEKFVKPIMEAIAEPRLCMAITDWNFEEFFSWLGKSVAIVSKSTPGERGQICDTSEEFQDMTNKFFDIM